MKKVLLLCGMFITFLLLFSSCEAWDPYDYAEEVSTNDVIEQQL
jgi:hypothetical protein